MQEADLVEGFIAALVAQGLANSVTVSGASHVGGHRFAGNVLIYPGGDWYGCVTPEEVARIVERHVVRGEIVTNLWRGRMGLSPEKQIEQARAWL